jgi:transposase-like protein
LKSGKSGKPSATKTPVLGIKDRRTGYVKATVIPDVTLDNVYPLIEDTVVHESIIVTDEANVYKHLKRNFVHARVNHSAKQYVDGFAHTNEIENFWSHLKRGIDGIYHWVSVPHLQSYVNKYTLRYNTRKLTTSGRFDLILSNVAGRLTYKELINKIPQK